jgi:hypothetical protein
MPRATKNPIVFLALSPAAVATALSIAPRKVYEAIESEVLPVFVNGLSRRCLVSDVETWVRSWPQIKPKRKRPHG